MGRAAGRRGPGHRGHRGRPDRGSKPEARARHRPAVGRPVRRPGVLCRADHRQAPVRRGKRARLLLLDRHRRRAPVHPDRRGPGQGHPAQAVRVVHRGDRRGRRPHVRPVRARPASLLRRAALPRPALLPAAHRPGFPGRHPDDPDRAARRIRPGRQRDPRHGPVPGRNPARRRHRRRPAARPEALRFRPGHRDRTSLERPHLRQVLARQRQHGLRRREHRRAVLDRGQPGGRVHLGSHGPC